ncbi:hypothetical protein [Mangrovimonas xylaniphaga]|uniref:hypothetical protein n=1 Tax=Mangrovimonas xylaniphaga TaxID=1645915 RepID=UPI0006B42D8A|nr:hypothetical protein [Mangrovimonas xylaniphaga]
MEANYLLPHRFKTIGWILLIVGLIIGAVLLWFGYESNLLTVKVLSIYNEDSILNETKGFFKLVDNSIVDELAALMIIVGGLFVGFSRETIEDEFIYKLRSESLVWAVVFNFVILILAILFVYNFTFFHVLVFNMFTPLIFFIVRFNFLKHKSVDYEE